MIIELGNQQKTGIIIFGIKLVVKVRMKKSLEITALFIDLADNEHQQNTRGHTGSTDYPDYKVNGYSISQLQNALKESRKLEHVTDYLQDKYHNTTEVHLSDLFYSQINYYNNWIGRDYFESIASIKKEIVWKEEIS